MQQNNTEKYPFFYAIKPEMLKADKFYKIYLTKNTVCGAKIAGQIFDENSAEAHLGFIGLFELIILPFIKKTIKNRYKRENKYDTIDLLSEQFINTDQHNFRYNINEISCITVNKKKTWHTGFYSDKGTLEVNFKNQTKQRFILPKDTNINEIYMLLSNLGTYVNVPV